MEKEVGRSSTKLNGAKLTAYRISIFVFTEWISVSKENKTTYSSVGDPKPTRFATQKISFGRKALCKN